MLLPNKLMINDSNI